MPNKKAMSPLLTTVLLVAALSTGSAAYGAGFGVFTQGASALGQADSVVAHTDEPSAVFFNPALLNRLPGTQVEIGTTLLFPSREFRNASTGARAETEDTLYYPSTIYISHAFNDKISAGLGVFTPFGLGTEWSGTWEGRYIATKSQIEAFDINPVVSYQITPGLSFAVGLDILLLDATLENKINLSSFGLPDASQKFKGDGTGLGYNFGLAADLGRGLTLGASYRSEITVDVSGDVTFGLPSPALGGTFPNTSGKTSITLPRQIFTGLAYRASDRLTLEAGYRWEEWSSFRELKLDLGQPVAGQTSITAPKKWRDTHTFNLGGIYKVTDTVSLMAGYLHSNNPVPDSTFEPSIPDSDTHLFTIGSEIKFDKIKVTASYGYQLLEERTKNNLVGVAIGGAANGAYNSDIHLLGLSVAYKF